jgi:hypothetical protein
LPHGEGAEHEHQIPRGGESTYQFKEREERIFLENEEEEIREEEEVHESDPQESEDSYWDKLIHMWKESGSNSGRKHKAPSRNRYMPIREDPFGSILYDFDSEDVSEDDNSSFKKASKSRLVEEMRRSVEEYEDVCSSFSENNHPDVFINNNSNESGDGNNIQNYASSISGALHETQNYLDAANYMVQSEVNSDDRATVNISADNFIRNQEAIHMFNRREFFREFSRAVLENITEDFNELERNRSSLNPQNSNVNRFMREKRFKVYNRQRRSTREGIISSSGRLFIQRVLSEVLEDTSVQLEHMNDIANLLRYILTSLKNEHSINININDFIDGI